MDGKQRRRQNRLKRHKARRKPKHGHLIKINSCAPTKVAREIIARNERRLGLEASRKQKERERSSGRTDKIRRKVIG